MITSAAPHLVGAWRVFRPNGFPSSLLELLRLERTAIPSSSRACTLRRQLELPVNSRRASRKRHGRCGRADITARFA